MTIILASQSPRREELLRRITSEFKVVPAAIDETSSPNQMPKEYVLAMATKKAIAVAEKYPDDTVIGCDTIVAMDTIILGKPESKHEAYQMLRNLSGKKHDVYTSIVVIKKEEIVSQTVHSTVEFYPLQDVEINQYLQTDEYKDKAGAYGIQGQAALFIKAIQGDYYAIMGLPIAPLKRLLRSIGQNLS